MTVEQFRERLDDIYATISYDDFDFIESLYKINAKANLGTKQGDDVKTSLLSTVAQMRNALTQEGASTTVTISAFPKSSWSLRMKEKPVQKSFYEVFSAIMHGARRNEAQLPRAAAAFRGMAFVFADAMDQGDEDCENPNRAYHHPNTF